MHNGLKTCFNKWLGRLDRHRPCANSTLRPTSSKTFLRKSNSSCRLWQRFSRSTRISVSFSSCFLATAWPSSAWKMPGNKLRWLCFTTWLFMPRESPSIHELWHGVSTGLGSGSCWHLSPRPLINTGCPSATLFHSTHTHPLAWVFLSLEWELPRAYLGQLGPKLGHVALEAVFITEGSSQFRLTPVE